MVKKTLCQICGKRMASDTHHLIFGTANRILADRDGITIDICEQCHGAIHGNGTASHLSKMLGQALWELREWQTGGEECGEVARDKFRQRYGKNFL